MKVAQQFIAGSVLILERPVPPGTIDERLLPLDPKADCSIVPGGTRTFKNVTPH
jgi:hypothetical protein